jgi:hypothetical protein
MQRKTLIGRRSVVVLIISPLQSKLLLWILTAWSKLILHKISNLQSSKEASKWQELGENHNKISQNNVSIWVRHSSWYNRRRCRVQHDRRPVTCMNILHAVYTQSLFSLASCVRCQMCLDRQLFFPPFWICLASCTYLVNTEIYFLCPFR